MLNLSVEPTHDQNKKSSLDQLSCFLSCTVYMEAYELANNKHLTWAYRLELDPFIVTPTLNSLEHRLLYRV